MPGCWMFINGLLGKGGVEKPISSRKNLTQLPLIQGVSAAGKREEQCWVHHSFQLVPGAHPGVFLLIGQWNRGVIWVGTNRFLKGSESTQINALH